MRRLPVRAILSSAGLAAMIAAFTLSPAGSAVRQRLSTVTSANEADNAFVYLNESTSGSGLSGQVGPAPYGSVATAGVFGVFSPSSTSAFGDGVVGLSSTGYGVVGEAVAGTYAAVYGQDFSAFGGPGVQGVSAGNGVVGQSSKSNAIVGQASQTTSSTSAGVLGQDTANSDEFNDGVEGTTTNGLFGVQGLATAADGIGGVGGYAASGAGVGVLGAGQGLAWNSYVNPDTSGWGVFGESSSADAGHFISTSGSGIAATSTTGFGTYSTDTDTATPSSTAPPYYESGVYGQSNAGQGVYGVNLHNTGSGVGYDTNRYAGVYGFGNDGPGVEGYSFSDIGMYAKNDNINYPTIFAENEAGTTSGGISFYAFNDVTDDYTIVDSKGDLYTSGSITSGSDTYQATTRNPGSDLTTYSAQHTEATVEDFGSAQLVNGTATIALASDFRQTINTALPYMVFLTPYGDNRGLYIASRTSAGFIVREAQSGRSTLAFDYRIVARPYGTLEARLPHLSTMHVAMLGQAEAARIKAARAVGRFGLERGGGVAPMANVAVRAVAHKSPVLRQTFTANHIPLAPKAQFTTR